MAIFNYDINKINLATPQGDVSEEQIRVPFRKGFDVDRWNESQERRKRVKETLQKANDLAAQVNEDGWKDAWYSYKPDAPDWVPKGEEEVAALKGVAPPDYSSTTTYDKEVPPTPAPEVKVEDIKPQTTSGKLFDYNFSGTPNYKFDVDAIQDEAYKQVMDDYHAEQKNVDKQRAYIDKAMDMDSRTLDRREKALDFIEGKYNYGAKQQEAESKSDWTDWLNPLGILKAPVRLFAGEEVYNPKSGQYERRMPTNWDDLAWNLLRNVGTLASGVEYTGGSGGRGGISFGYNHSVPMALRGLQRENAYAPFKDWEDIQRAFANDARQGSFKSWTINNPYPKAQNPFEEGMRRRVADEMAFNDAIATKQRLMEYLGIKKGTSEEDMLDQQIFGMTKKLGSDLFAFQEELRNSGLDYTDDEIKELSKEYLLQRKGLGASADKRAANDLKKYEIDQKTAIEVQKLRQAADQAEKEGKKTEAEILKIQAETLLNQAKTKTEENKANGGADNNVPALANMNNDLLNDGNAWFTEEGDEMFIKQGKDGKPLITPEEAKDWIARYDKLMKLAATQDKGVNFGSISFGDKMNPDFSKVLGLSKIRKNILKLYPQLKASEESGEQKKNSEVNPPTSLPMEQTHDEVEVADEKPPLPEPMPPEEDYADDYSDDDVEKEYNQLSKQDKDWVDWARRLYSAESKMMRAYQATSDFRKKGSGSMFHPFQNLKSYFSDPDEYANSMASAERYKPLMDEGLKEMKSLKKDLEKTTRKEDRKVGEIVREIEKDPSAWSRAEVELYKSLTPTRYKILSVIFDPVAEDIVNYEKAHNGEKPPIEWVNERIYSTLSELPEVYQNAIQHDTIFEDKHSPANDGLNFRIKPTSKKLFAGNLHNSSYDLNRSIVLDYLKTNGIY